MNIKNIKSRIDFLINFLDLLEISKLVSCLSAGQKKKVSLAVAIVHNPPLLMLDEPTLGIDPLLRQRY
jgi:ABC-2 type transport system ATP-binding protein